MNVPKAPIIISQIFLINALIALLSLAATPFAIADAASNLPTPPEVWKNYDPDAGDYKEEIIREETKDGVYYKDAYISAYINGEEVRVFCKYAVKAGAKKAPGLMNVHGWMSGPAIDMKYVNDGWAVMSHDYSGITKRPHHTKYPEAMGHGHMEAKKMGYRLIYDRMPDGSQLTDPTATSHYLWNAVQRRALSYLLAQKEVDAERIGAKGYSYGGTIMWNLGMDPRVKAIVAYFGIGWITYYRDRAVWMYNNPYQAPEQSSGQKLFLSAVAPQAHAPHITAASLWLNGSNDHHGGHERAGQTFELFKSSVPWDFAVQARGHHNTEKLGDNCKLWLEKHVLGKDHFWPARPQSKIVLGSDGVPELHLTPTHADQIKELQIYQCLGEANNIARYWRDVKSVRNGDTWIAKLPVMNVDDYVFSYANIRYQNDCVVSSDFEAVIPSKLGDAIATDAKTNELPGGADKWKHSAPAEGVGGISGFRPIDNRRGTSSSQFSDPKYKAPRGASLSFKFYCTQPQKLTMSANKGYSTELDITASNEWQNMTIPANEIRNNGVSLSDWSVVGTIGIKPKSGADITKVVFAEFKWVIPELKPDAQGRYYLTPAMAGEVDSFWQVMQDKSVEGKEKIRVGGRTYDRGLGVHAPSKMVFPLEGKYKTLHIVPGTERGGLVEMKILVDDKEVFTTGKIPSSSYQTKALDIPLTNAKKFTLIVTDGGNGGGGDHASWADAYLTK